MCSIASGKLDVSRVTLHKFDIMFVVLWDGRSCCISGPSGQRNKIQRQKPQFKPAKIASGQSKNLEFGRLKLGTKNV